MSEREREREKERARIREDGVRLSWLNVRNGGQSEPIKSLSFPENLIAFSL